MLFHMKYSCLWWWEYFCLFFCFFLLSDFSPISKYNIKINKIWIFMDSTLWNTVISGIGVFNLWLLNSLWGMFQWGFFILEDIDAFKRKQRSQNSCGSHSYSVLSILCTPKSLPLMCITGSCQHCSANPSFFLNTQDMTTWADSMGRLILHLLELVLFQILTHSDAYSLLESIWGFLSCLRETEGRK